MAGFNATMKAFSAPASTPDVLAAGAKSARAWHTARADGVVPAARAEHGARGQKLTSGRPGFGARS